MARDSYIKQQEAISLDALVKTASRIAKRLPGVEAPDIPTRHRYPEMLAMTQMEALAGFLDQLDQRLKDEGYSAMSEPKDTEQPADEADNAAPQPDPAKTEVPQSALDEPEAPSDDAADKSDVDDTDETDAGAAFVETVKTKAKGR